MWLKRLWDAGRDSSVLGVNALGNSPVWTGQRGEPVTSNILQSDSSALSWSPPMKVFHGHHCTELVVSPSLQSLSCTTGMTWPRFTMSLQSAFRVAFALLNSGSPA